jgi:hypothetical protein
MSSRTPATKLIVVIAFLAVSDNVTISAIYFGRAGRCFEFDGHSYALESRSLAKKFTALSRELR